MATERTRANGLGWMSPDAMRQTIEIPHSGGNMPRMVTPEEAATNAFLTKVVPGS